MTDLFIVSIVLTFLECHIVGITQYAAFSDGLLSFSNMHLGFLHVFRGLTAHFFLVLDTSLLSECTTVYLPIHLWKDILVASKCWQL